MSTVAPATEMLDPARLVARGIRSYLPWSSDAVLRLIIADAVGLGMIVASWYITSGQTHLHDQTTWLKLGIAGLAVCGIANGLWLLRGRQAVGLARVALLAQFAPASNAVPVAPTAAADVLVAGDAMTRYHRVGCPLVSGKPVSRANQAEHLANGRRPCELCLS